MKTSPLYPRPQSLAQTLDRLPQLAAALPVARRSSPNAAETSRLMDLIPDALKAKVTAIALEDACLRVVVTSHEAAHATRLERPTILAAARARTLKCSEVRVQVQTATRRQALPRPRPTAQTLHRLKTAAADMKSERLQTALNRLVDTLERMR